MSEPRVIIRQQGVRGWGFMAWRVWVEYDRPGSRLGPMRLEHEYGTYAWSRRGAERRGRALLRHHRRHYQPGPEIEVS